MGIAGSNDVYFPTGTEVYLKPEGESVYLDVGCIMAASTGTHNYEVDVIECSTGAKLKRFKNQTLTLAFTMGNLNVANIVKMSAGMFNYVSIDGTPYTPNDQIIAADWIDKSLIEIDTNKTALESVIATVTGSTTGLLVVDDDYTIVESAESKSGWAVIINTSGVSGAVTTESITIVFGVNTPLESEKLTCGDATGNLNPAMFKFIAPDDSGRSRFMEVYSATLESGGFVFGFTDVATGGIEQMPITATGEIDTTRTAGDQLFNWGYVKV